MGLLQYITLHYYSKKSLNTGLLRLAEKFLEKNNHTICDSFILDKPFYQFHNFSSELELFKTALFVPHNKQYTILFSHNLDNISIQKSVSSFDFWNGILSNSSWVTFTDSALSSFSQFFSESDREMIKSINARWVSIGSQKCIFLVCTSKSYEAIDYVSLDEVLPTLISELTQTVENYMPDSSLQNDLFNEISCLIREGLKIYNKAHCFELSNDEILNSTLLTKHEKKYILFELFCRMKFATVKPNICFLSNDHSLKLILFSHEDIDPDMYQMYLQQNLEEYFLPETLSAFIIKDKSVLTSNIDIENFLLTGV